MTSRYYTNLAAAFVRGSLGEAAPDLSAGELIEHGRAAGLAVHRFKRTSLPRVQRVVGTLRVGGKTLRVGRRTPRTSRRTQRTLCLTETLSV